MSSSTARRIRIVCISDTNNDDSVAQIPDGDMLIHAGDMIHRRALAWIRKFSRKLKIVIAGPPSPLPAYIDAYRQSRHGTRSFSQKLQQIVARTVHGSQCPRRWCRIPHPFLHDDILSIYANPKKGNGVLRTVVRLLYVFWREG
jgi:hypothetical protein